MGINALFLEVVFVLYNDIIVSCWLLKVFLDQFINMGVACGPGFPLQVLAWPALKPDTRCGLFTAIPNAAPHTIVKICFIHHHVFFRISLMVIRNNVD